MNERGRTDEASGKMLTTKSTSVECEAPRRSHPLSASNKRSKSLKEKNDSISKGAHKKLPLSIQSVNVNLNTTKEGGALSATSQVSVDQILKSFAQAVSFKATIGKIKEEKKIFDESEFYEKKLYCAPRKVLEVIQEVSLRSNFKIKDFGNNKLELVKDTIKILSEITISSVKEQKCLKFTKLSGSNQKANDLVNRILSNVELLEKKMQKEIK